MSNEQNRWRVVQENDASSDEGANGRIEEIEGEFVENPPQSPQGGQPPETPPPPDSEGPTSPESGDWSPPEEFISYGLERIRQQYNLGRVDASHPEGLPPDIVSMLQHGVVPVNLHLVGDPRDRDLILDFLGQVQREINEIEGVDRVSAASLAAWLRDIRSLKERVKRFPERTIEAVAALEKNLNCLVWQVFIPEADVEVLTLTDLNEGFGPRERVPGTGMLVPPIDLVIETVELRRDGDLTLDKIEDLMDRERAWRDQMRRFISYAKVQAAGNRHEIERLDKDILEHTRQHRVMEALCGILKDQIKKENEAAKSTETKEKGPNYWLDGFYRRLDTLIRTEQPSYFEVNNTLVQDIQEWMAMIPDEVGEWKSIMGIERSFKERVRMLSRAVIAFTDRYLEMRIALGSGTAGEKVGLLLGYGESVPRIRCTTIEPEHLTMMAFWDELFIAEIAKTDEDGEVYANPEYSQPFEGAYHIWDVLASPAMRSISWSSFAQEGLGAANQAYRVALEGAVQPDEPGISDEERANRRNLVDKMLDRLPHDMPSLDDAYTSASLMNRFVEGIGQVVRSPFAVEMARKARVALFRFAVEDVHRSWHIGAYLDKIFISATYRFVSNAKVDAKVKNPACIFFLPAELTEKCDQAGQQAVANLIRLRNWHLNTEKAIEAYRLGGEIGVARLMAGGKKPGGVHESQARDLIKAYNRARVTVVAEKVGIKESESRLRAIYHRAGADAVRPLLANWNIRGRGASALLKSYQKQGEPALKELADIAQFKRLYQRAGKAAREKALQRSRTPKGLTQEKLLRLLEIGVTGELVDRRYPLTVDPKDPLIGEIVADVLTTCPIQGSKLDTALRDITAKKVSGQPLAPDEAMILEIKSRIDDIRQRWNEDGDLRALVAQARSKKERGLALTGSEEEAWEHQQSIDKIGLEGMPDIPLEHFTVGGSWKTIPFGQLSETFYNGLYMNFLWIQAMTFMEMATGQIDPRKLTDPVAVVDGAVGALRNLMDVCAWTRGLSNEANIQAYQDHVAILTANVLVQVSPWRKDAMAQPFSKALVPASEIVETMELRTTFGLTRERAPLVPALLADGLITPGHAFRLSQFAKELGFSIGHQLFREIFGPEKPPRW
ncbi:MAG TPA: hypothetical protein VMW41_00835 [Candidatus Bathyarchaeia archaeon]|nr:hypothetical protein [Candidatus Bathyarchaeia archaeon]